jgi:hypothetical protein
MLTLPPSVRWQKIQPSAANDISTRCSLQLIDRSELGKMAFCHAKESSSRTTLQNRCEIRIDRFLQAMRAAAMGSAAAAQLRITSQ